MQQNFRPPEHEAVVASSNRVEVSIVTWLPGVKPPRIDSIDLLRGVVMVLMALDHTRDFFTNVTFAPLDLSQTTAALFFTRWITHFCAPTFVFLAGTGAFLSRGRGKSKEDLARFLVTRGLWLVVLELTAVRFGWTFNLDYTFTVGQVIWVIGWSMVALAPMVLFLSARAIGVIGIAIIVVHNALDAVLPDQFGSIGWLWQLLHVQSLINYSDGLQFFVVYPFIPWIGVMAAGYGFGELAKRPDRRRAFLRLGVALTVLFVVLRASNLYGDPHPWSMQKSLVFAFMSFINCEKYPPSLLYLFMTLGPAIASLAFFERAKGRIGNFFLVFGRVPLFYYVLHVPFIHSLAVALAYMRGFDPAWLFANFPEPGPPGFGFGLLPIYVIWMFVVVALYPLCAWFAAVKRRSRNVLLSYL